MMFPVQVVGLMAFFFFGQVRFMRKSCMWYVYLCYVSLFGYSLLCWSTAISVFPSLQRRRKEGRKEGSGYGVFEVLPRHLPYRDIIKPRQGFSHDSKYPYRDSNRAPDEYRDTLLLLR